VTRLSRRTPTVRRANLFSIPLGFAGVAQVWTAAADVQAVPRWPADGLWVAAAAVWLVVAVDYYGRHLRPSELAKDLADAIFGPFVPVSTIVPMMLGGALARHAPAAGTTIFVVATVATLLYGGWLSGEWILRDGTLAQWHPGYFLPTVAGGYVGAGISAGLGNRTVALVLFGYGSVCWIVLGSIILARLFTQPMLPPALRSTLAVEIAPPVVGGSAWFQINGGRVDEVALLVAGYALLMAMVQLRLIPLFRTVPFGPAWWAFSFSYAATAGYGIRWLEAAGPTPPRVCVDVMLVITTALGLLLAARTAVAIARHRFFTPGPATVEAARSAATPDAPMVEVGHGNDVDHGKQSSPATRIVRG
jgi:tellurite resistance protein